MRIWLRFLRLIRPYQGRLLLTFIATAARPVLNAAKIYLLKLIIDNLARNPSGNIVLVICGGYLVIALAKGAFTYTDEYLGTYVGGRVIIDLRQRVFDRFMRLSLRYHGEHRVGESISRLVSDVGAVEGVLVGGLTDGVSQALAVLIFTGLLFYLDPQLALISLLVLPFLAASLAVYARRSRVAFQQVRERLSDLTATAEETLSSISLVKTYVRQAVDGARFHARTEAHWQARLRAARQRAIFVPISDVISTAGTVLVVYFGAQALSSGTLSLGGLVVFLAYLGQLYTPLVGLSRLGNSLQGGMAAAERVAAVIDLPTDEDEPFAATQSWQPLSPFQEAQAPAISFEHVTFSYAPGRRVLNDFCLRVPRGAFVALVGPSGGGKSTAVALLQRLYEADSGQIKLFGYDIRAATSAQLRAELAVVHQEAILRMGTVADNIAYGDLDAGPSRILRAAEQANIPEMRLPDGLDTEVGTRGAKLSGGQRQRVAIARALVRDAPILVLDEATSALDALSEEHLCRLLTTLRPRHTVVLVAHRLSTVRSADLIAMVDHGQVVEFGPPASLLARGGLYARFVEAQLTARGTAPAGAPAPPTISRAG